ncbi:MAG: winged helix-turn-helix domain-containing protein [Gammaproteobacteria bacterium]|nr:winged helix-turn-helix domain-containing protein [Gammaproteobacteria bacterium]
MCDLLDRASDAALAVDTNLKITGWNQGAESLLGYSAEAVSGMRCGEVLQAILPNGTPLCGPLCTGGLCLSRSEPFSIDLCRARHRDGHWVTVSISSIVTRFCGNPLPGCQPVAIFFLHNAAGAQCAQSINGMPRLFTFGQFGLVINNRVVAVENWARRQALTLLKYLLTYRGTEVHRERLMDCLWPDANQSQSRGRLKVTVYFLRNQFREVGVRDPIVATTNAGYLLNRGAVWLDSEYFDQLIREGAVLQGRRRWQEALRCYQDACLLYRGDYLQEDLYADWCAEERERLRETHLDVLARMACIYTEHEQYAEAVYVCRKALAHEPCREGFHRTLMSCLAQLGRADEALAQYRRCQSVLAREIGVGPMPETERLYRHILAGNALLPSPPVMHR